MTAMENVMVGADARHKTSVPGALFRLARVRPKPHELPDNALKASFAKVFGISRHALEERAGRRKAMELLRFVGIADRAHELARNLPYGYQRRLEIARALATEPKLLCLDEPAAGFNPAEKADLMDLIRRIRDSGLTVLLIEHDMSWSWGSPTGSSSSSSARRSPRACPRRWPATPRSSLPTWESRTMLLELEDVVLNYGKIEALHGISLEVAEGEVVALIGANGAGKTSTMRAMSGVRGLHSGAIIFDGEDVTKLRADQRVRKGLCQSPRRAAASSRA